MAITFRRAERWLSALAAVLGSTALTFAQAPTSGAPTALDVPSFPLVVPAAKAAITTPDKAPDTAASAPDSVSAVERAASKLKANEATAPSRDAASLVERAASKFKVDEAAAPSRRAAIQYLATVKCQYDADAEAALITALRADRNEEVRVEAASALAAGCCVTSKTRDALVSAAGGVGRDGFPAETAEAVKTAARQALRYYVTQGMTVPAALTTTVAAKTPTGHAKAPPPMAMGPIAVAKGNVPPPKVAPAELQQVDTATITVPGPKATSPVTTAEMRFAETAGVASSAPSAATPPNPVVSTLRRPRTVRPVPAVHLTPIGVVPQTGQSPQIKE